MNRKCLGRVIATLSRRRSVKKPSLAAKGADCHLFDLTQLKMMMSFS